MLTIFILSLWCLSFNDASSFFFSVPFSFFAPLLSIFKAFRFTLQSSISVIFCYISHFFVSYNAMQSRCVEMCGDEKSKHVAGGKCGGSQIGCWNEFKWQIGSATPNSFTATMPEVLDLTFPYNLVFNIKHSVTLML